MYPCLLEKAVAILCGGFDYIQGNQPSFALGMMTGCQNVHHFSQEASKGKWTGGRMEFTADRCHGSAACDE